MPQPIVAPARVERRPLLVILSHLRWDFVFQRPHHLATRAAEDYDVLFIEEPRPDAEGFALRQSVRENGVQLIQPLVPADASQADILEHQKRIVAAVLEAAEERVRVLWYYTPMALAFTRALSADLVVFDKMDELSAFAHAPPELRKMEEELLRRSDIVFTGGASLHQATIGRHENVFCFPSSIDRAHFGRARSIVDEPEDLASLARPRIGYFGVIDERVDYGLIADLAAIRPHWQIVMIGPTAKVDEAKLPRAANLHWLGAKPYAALPSYLAHWDIGWMPFALNDATRFISPTKTPEFLAAGLPLVSSPIRDVVEPYGRLSLVKIAGGVAEHAGAIEAALADLPSEEARRRRLADADAYLAQGSWDRTWAEMDSIMTETVRARLERPRVATMEVAVV